MELCIMLIAAYCMSCKKQQCLVRGIELRQFNYFWRAVGYEHWMALLSSLFVVSAYRHLKSHLHL